MLGFRNVRSNSAQNPEPIDRKILPSFGRPHQPPLLALVVLETEPAIFIAHRNVRSRLKWFQTTIRIHPAISRSVLRGGPGVVATSVLLSPLTRRWTDKPHVPLVPIGIYKISESHSHHSRCGTSYEKYWQILCPVSASAAQMCEKKTASQLRARGERLIAARKHMPSFFVSPGVEKRTCFDVARWSIT